jgi:homogentisate 1,2-dioxygenase
MLHRHTLGKIPPKPHTTLYEDGKLLMEQEITRAGFNGPFSSVYYRTPPTDEHNVRPLAIDGFCPVQFADAGPLRRYHIKTQDHQPQGNYLTGRRTLFVSTDLEVGVCKPAEPSRQCFCNGDGDELYFVTRGGGTLESIYGVLPFGAHDYVLIPKGTPYRLRCGADTVLLICEGRAEIAIPGDYRNNWGQLSDFAPYSHRDFRLPMELAAHDPAEHGQPPFEMVVKRGGELTVRDFQHYPLEVAGWDGCIYPVAFNIHDFQPKTGQVHLPPTIHTTFAGGGRYVICSFVPRVVDFHKDAIPCPYAHANVDMDEILYYVEGNFTSRKGIDSQSISLHPAGITHGPHPGMYEKSVGAKTTSELAVMIDGYAPFRLTTAAMELDEKDYHYTWVK